jgi:hypothetical protein
VGDPFWHDSQLPFTQRHSTDFAVEEDLALVAEDQTRLAFLMPPGTGILAERQFEGERVHMGDRNGAKGYGYVLANTGQTRLFQALGTLECKEAPIAVPPIGGKSRLDK